MKCERVLNISPLRGRLRASSSPVEECPFPLGEIPNPAATSPSPRELLGAQACLDVQTALAHSDKLFMQKTTASLTKDKNISCRNAIKGIALKKNRCGTLITDYSLLALMNQYRNWS